MYVSEKELHRRAKRDEALRRLLYDGPAEGWWYWDMPQQEAYWVSDSFWEALAYPSGDGLHWENLAHPDDLERALAAYGQYMQAPHVPLDLLLRFRRRDGQWVWIRSRGALLRSQDGDVLGLAGAFAEVTAYVQRLLRWAAASPLFAESERPRCLLSCWGHILWNNAAFSQMLGYAAGAFLGRHIADFAYAEDRQKSLAFIAELPKAQERTRQCYKRYVHQAGQVLYARSETSFFPNMAGLGAHFVKDIYDVTADAGLAEEIRFKNLALDQVGDAIIATDAHSRIKYWNLAAEKLYGWRAEEVLGKNILDVTPVKARVVEANAIVEDVRKASAWNGEFEVRDKAGREFWVRVHNTPLLDDEGEIIGIVGISEDITPLKSAEEAARYMADLQRLRAEVWKMAANYEDERALTQALLDTIGPALRLDNVSFMPFDPNKGKIVVEQIWRHDGLKLGLGDTVPNWVFKWMAGKEHFYVAFDDLPAALRPILRPFQKRYGTKTSLVLPYGDMRRPAGFVTAQTYTYTKRYTDTEILVLKDLCNIIYTRSQQIQARAALENSERRATELARQYKDILDNQSVYIIKTNAQGRYTYMNDHYKSKFGLGDAMLGRESWHNIFEEDHGKCAATVRLCYEKPGERHSVVLRKRDAEGKLCSNKWEFRSLSDGQGQIVEILCMGFDVTPEIVNLERAERLLDLSERQNLRLRSFAHIVSHNIRSHAANILGLAGILQDSQPQEQAAFLDMLSTSAQRLDETIHDLNQVLQVNEQGPHLPKMPCNLARSVRRALDALQFDIQRLGAQVSLELPDTLQVPAVPAYLDSIVLNLLSNALKYRSPKRPLQVRIAGAAGPEGIVCSVADNGLGIDLKRHGSSLFGMYKTFHQHPEARGFGLFMTKSQIVAMGGHINAESVPGEGSRFTFVLPAD